MTEAFKYFGEAFKYFGVLALIIGSVAIGSRYAWPGALPVEFMYYGIAVVLVGLVLVGIGMELRRDRRPHPCPQCRGELRSITRNPERGTGCVIAVLGLVLAPVLIGIPLILWGLVMASREERTWHCVSCGRAFPA